MLLALVDEEGAREARGCPLVDEEMGWHRQLHVSFRHFEKHPAMSGSITDSLTNCVKRGATSASELVGEKKRRESRSQVQPGKPVIQCDYCFLKAAEEAPNVTVLMTVDTVKKQVDDCNPIFSQVAVWPHSHDTSDTPK